MKFNLNYFIIFLGLILFSIVILPIFKEGYPLNTDLMPQYLRLKCLSESGIAPNNWCPYVNGGIPSSQYYYPTIDQIAAFLGKFISLLFVYKVILVLAIIIPALGIWLWLKDRHPFGAAVGFLMYLLFTAGWHGGGFEETIIVGFWHYMLSIGFLFIALYYYDRWLKDDKLSTKVKAILFTTLISHPMTLLIGVVFYVIVTLCNWSKVKWKSIGTFILYSLGINAFYIVPLFAKLKYFPSNVGGMINWELFYAYILHPIPWYLWATAIAGIFFVIYLKDKDNYSFVGISLALAIYMLVDTVKTPFTTYQIGVRIGAFIGPTIIILSALAFDYLYTKVKIKGNDIIKWVTVILGIVLLSFMFTNVYKYKDVIIMSSDEAMIPQMQFYESLSSLGPGRIFSEDMLYTMGNSIYSMGHIDSMIPILTGKEIIGFAPTIFPKFNSSTINLLDTSGPSILNTNLEDWDKERLLEIFNRYNIKYVLSHSPNQVQFFDKMFGNQTVIGPYHLYDTGINASYFSGNVINSKYERTKAETFALGATTIYFKVNNYANWKAHQYNNELTIYDCNGIMCVNVIQAGNVYFEYKLIYVDYVGYILTLLTLIIIGINILFVIDLERGTF